MPDLLASIPSLERTFGDSRLTMWVRPELAVSRIEGHFSAEVATEFMAHAEPVIRRSRAFVGFHDWTEAPTFDVVVPPRVGAWTVSLLSKIARTSDRPPSRTSDRPPDFAQKLMPGHVLRVAKRADAAFAERIGIGRAPNADVRIPIAQVSKYHAFFAHGLESWTLTDAGSSNGTFVADVELEARVPHPVADGVEVAFGACRLRFYTPEGFVRFATSRLR